MSNLDNIKSRFWLVQLQESIKDAEKIVESCNSISELIEEGEQQNEELLKKTHYGVSGLVWLLELHFAIIKNNLQALIQDLKDQEEEEEEEEEEEKEEESKDE
jgi:hypothetical protein